MLGKAACIARQIEASSSMPGAKENKPSIKKAAARMVRELPDSANWDDLMYEILVRQKIEAGLADFEAGRTHDHASIRKEFGLA
jgi:hypothetical protein